GFRALRLLRRGSLGRSLLRQLGRGSSGAPGSSPARRALPFSSRRRSSAPCMHWDCLSIPLADPDPISDAIADDDDHADEDSHAITVADDQLPSLADDSADGDARGHADDSADRQSDSAADEHAQAHDRNTDAEPDAKRDVHIDARAELDADADSD